MAKKATKFPAKVSKDAFFDSPNDGTKTMIINDNGIAMIKNLASLGTPFNEIAILLGCSPTTLRTDANKERVQIAYEQGTVAGHTIIRKALQGRIQQGSDKCIIFASKATLGMSDTILPSTEASALDGFIRAIDRAKAEDTDEEDED